MKTYSKFGRIKSTKKGLKMEKLSCSLENYLYKIYELKKTNEKVLPKSVASSLNFNMSSTSEAIKILEGKDFIEYKRYLGINLTKQGEKYAKAIEKRRFTIKSFLKNFLLVEEDNLDIETGSFEYFISDYLLERFNYLLDFSNFCPLEFPKWIEGFNSYLKNGELTDECAKCIENASNSINVSSCSSDCLKK